MSKRKVADDFDNVMMNNVREWFRRKLTQESMTRKESLDKEVETIDRTLAKLEEEATSYKDKLLAITRQINTQKLHRQNVVNQKKQLSNEASNRATETLDGVDDQEIVDSLWLVLQRKGGSKSSTPVSAGKKMSDVTETPKSELPDKSAPQTTSPDAQQPPLPVGIGNGTDKTTPAYIPEEVEAAEDPDPSAEIPEDTPQEEQAPVKDAELEPATRSEKDREPEVQAEREPEAEPAPEPAPEPEPERVPEPEPEPEQEITVTAEPTGVSADSGEVTTDKVEEVPKITSAKTTPAKTAVVKSPSGRATPRSSIEAAKAADTNGVEAPARPEKAVATMSSGPRRQSDVPKAAQKKRDAVVDAIEVVDLDDDEGETPAPKTKSEFWERVNNDPGNLALWIEFAHFMYDSSPTNKVSEAATILCKALEVEGYPNKSSKELWMQYIAIWMPCNPDEYFERVIQQATKCVSGVAWYTIARNAKKLCEENDSVYYDKWRSGKLRLGS